MISVGDGSYHAGVHVVLSPRIRADAGRLDHLVRAAFTGVDPSGVEVWMEPARRRGDAFTGRAYSEPPRRGVHPGTLYLVRLALPSVLRNRGYPKAFRYPGLKTAPWITVADWQERLVALAAHEACHVRQFRDGLRRSEVEAERWADRTLHLWREEGMAPDGTPADPVPALAERPGIACWRQLSLLEAG